jgi:hypothetical protein
MDLREFLLEGGVISFPYKREKKEWCGTAKLHISPGYFSSPKVIFDNEYERKEYTVDYLNDAIKNFTETVFTPMNLMYKMNPAIIKAKGINNQFIDLDVEEDFNKVENIRQSMTKDSIKK